MKRLCWVGALWLASLLLFGLWMFLAAEYRKFPYRYVKNLEMAARVVQDDWRQRELPEWGRVFAELTRPPVIETTFFDLQVHRVPVPVAMDGRGGALTSVGDQLLLVAFDGTFFRVDRNGAARLALQPPDIGLAEFRELVENPLPGYRFHPTAYTLPRFHDVLFYRDHEGGNLLVSYTRWHPNRQCYQTMVSRLRLGAGADLTSLRATPEDWQPVFATQPCLPLNPMEDAVGAHVAGGRMAYLGDGNIALTSGDYFFDGVKGPFALAQEPDNHYGKVLQVNVDSGRVEILSLGHRNMQGVLLDDNGDLWGLEHGPRGGDELNRIVRGGNYGWPRETLGLNYDRKLWPTSSEPGRLRDSIYPAYAWLPSVAVSSLVQLHNFHPAWDGDFLAGSLKGKTLFRLRLHERQVLFVEPVVINERIRYVHQHTDGQLVLWTDDGEVLFLDVVLPPP